MPRPHRNPRQPTSGRQWGSRFDPIHAPSNSTSTTSLSSPTLSTVTSTLSPKENMNLLHTFGKRDGKRSRVVRESPVSDEQLYVRGSSSASSMPHNASVFVARCVSRLPLLQLSSLMTCRCQSPSRLSRLRALQSPLRSLQQVWQSSSRQATS